MNADRIRRAIRAHPALFGDLGPDKAVQCARILEKTAKRLRPVWSERAERVAHARGQRILYTWA